MASERLNLFLKALFAEDNALALASVSQAKCLSATATKLLRGIKKPQESMQWERFLVKFFRGCYVNPGKRLEDLEINLKGMEMALTSISSFPVEMLDSELKDGLYQVEKHISLTLQQCKKGSPCDSLTVPESNADNVMKALESLQTMPTTHQDLPLFFFIYCLKLLQSTLLAKTSAKPQDKSLEDKENSTDTFKEQIGHLINRLWSDAVQEVSTKRLMPAFKCSLSLGLAVFFGLIYSKENGYWSGLPVAITLASAREATVKVANVKAQGTVLGTVYGVLGCFLFERFLVIRFASLLPWFIFTSFLQRSKMYGQAGGISAVIGAVLLLGRRNFGPPGEFAIARIIETFIGLSCSVMVDLLFQPKRAASLAKVQLSRSLGTLHKCINSLSSNLIWKRTE